MNWLLFSIDVPRELAEAVTAALESAGALSVSLQDAAHELLVEPLPGAQPIWRNPRVVALFSAAADAAAVEAALRAVLGEPLPPLAVSVLEDRDWSNTWRDTFRPMRFGARLWVCPSGAACPDAGAAVITLDPGVAFGTGTHATTALCLEWLDHHPPVARRVIDYGCGSGILALAAARLGAAQVLATDIDPAALAVTRANAAANGIVSGIDVCLPDDLDRTPADLVLANILANPLVELAPVLSALLRPGGTLLLTGILATQAEAVSAAYAPWIVFDAPQQREEWVLLTGTKHTAGA
ncbi:MAG: 50S ribosomal protein L11 methyltransferase [Pseudomonadota bacterium]